MTTTLSCPVELDMKRWPGLCLRFWGQFPKAARASFMKAADSPWLRWTAGVWRKSELRNSPLPLLKPARPLDERKLGLRESGDQGTASRSCRGRACPTLVKELPPVRGRQAVPLQIVGAGPAPPEANDNRRAEEGEWLSRECATDNHAHIHASVCIQHLGGRAAVGADFNESGTPYHGKKLRR